MNKAWAEQRNDVPSFYALSPPWGAKGCSERRREEADYQYKGKFFKWVNDDKHEA
jgi:hypothetical protein